MVVTVAKGYDLGYIWKTQTEHDAGRTTGGYYINAAQAGEPPGRWWGPGAQALGFTPGQVVQRKPYDAVYRQIDPRTGARLGRPRGRYPTFADHLLSGAQVSHGRGLLAALGTPMRGVLACVWVRARRRRHLTDGRAGGVCWLPRGSGPGDGAGPGLRAGRAGRHGERVGFGAALPVTFWRSSGRAAG